jgi:hypothetical protein
MQPYPNKSHHSGVTHFEIGEDYIRIKFQGESSVYTYSYALNGKRHIEKMKSLAKAGIGLGTYISQHPEVRDHFQKR